MGGDHFPTVDTPRPVKFIGESFQKAIWPGFLQLFSASKQVIPKTMIHQAILNPPVSSWGSTGQFIPVEDQFKKYTYPIPKEEGGTEVHMIWMDNPCRTTCWNNSFLSIEAYRSPKIECFVVQHPWMENDTVFADIILPISTKFEEDDIAEMHKSPLKGLVMEERAIEPIGEAKSDYLIVAESGKYIDRGGANNLISPENILSQNCGGQATSGYLVEVSKVTLEQMDEWKQLYPDAFRRDYKPGAGLRFENWVEE
jgi:trimethylamine-N-oxide reductase (cytochrome c)